MITIEVSYLQSWWEEECDNIQVVEKIHSNYQESYNTSTGRHDHIPTKLQQSPQLQVHKNTSTNDLATAVSV